MCLLMLTLCVLRSMAATLCVILLIQKKRENISFAIDFIIMCFVNFTGKREDIKIHAMQRNSLRSKVII